MKYQFSKSALVLANEPNCSRWIWGQCYFNYGMCGVGKQHATRSGEGCRIIGITSRCFKSCELPPPPVPGPNSGSKCIWGQHSFYILYLDDSKNPLKLGNIQGSPNCSTIKRAIMVHKIPKKIHVYVTETGGAIVEQLISRQWRLRFLLIWLYETI